MTAYGTDNTRSYSCPPHSAGKAKERLNDLIVGCPRQSHDDMDDTVVQCKKSDDAGAAGFNGDLQGNSTAAMLLSLFQGIPDARRNRF